MKSIKSDSEIEFAFDAPQAPRAPLGGSSPEIAAPPVPAEDHSNPGAAAAEGFAGSHAGPDDPASSPEGAVAPPAFDDSAEDGETIDEESDASEEETEDPAGDFDEAEDPHGEILVEIRDELAATSTENRRNTRRIFDALKQFGGVLDALSATVNNIHSTTRAQTQPTARATDQVKDVIELADRVDRIAAAFAREPSPSGSWWPPARRAIEAWRSDRARLADSFSILATHVRAHLKNAGLERIACEGEPFDPACMQADEVVVDPRVDDHTVIAELLPGWREAAGGRVVRPAHVRVSRSR